MNGMLITAVSRSLLTSSDPGLNGCGLGACIYTCAMCRRIICWRERQLQLSLIWAQNRGG